ncbi:MAG: hypothetical protein ACP5GX_12160 [Anaerolineae bacterium]
MTTESSEIPEIQEPKLTPEEQAQAERRTQMMIIGGAVLFLLLLITAIVLMASYPSATTVVRDIAIVFVAVETFLIGIAVIVLAVQVQILVKVLREEIQPLLRSVNDTASTVRGTTEFVSDNFVSPIIKVAGFTAGVQKVASNLKGVISGLRPRSGPATHIQQGGREDGREE